MSEKYTSDTRGCPSVASMLSAAAHAVLPRVGAIRLPEDDAPPFVSGSLPDLPYDDTVLLAAQLGAESATAKLVLLRRLMRSHNIGVYIVPSEDEHHLEYTALADRRREYLSGFSGSAGVAVVTLDDAATLSGAAALLTDGRYFLQAERQLDLRHWRLLKQGAAGHPTWQQYAIDAATSSRFLRVVSCDPRLVSLAVGQHFERAAKRRRFEFKPLGVNLVDEMWLGKPQRSLEPVYVLEKEYSGRSVREKVGDVRAAVGAVALAPTALQALEVAPMPALAPGPPAEPFLRAEPGSLTADVVASGAFNASAAALSGTASDAYSLVIAGLDEIAWLLNLRCDADIPFSPVFFAYAILTPAALSVYIDPRKVTPAVERHLLVAGVTLLPYTQFYADLARVRNPILPDRAAALYALATASATPPAAYRSVVANLKIVKNATELRNARLAQAKDLLAFVVFAAWLDHELVARGNAARVTEYDAACKIYAIRARLPHFKGLLYETISSTGPNAAMIHYAPTRDNHRDIDTRTPYLIDSGAHYLEGTTDITRTYMFAATVPPQYRKWYTLVLRGHLAVAMAKFPPHLPATGTLLDAYARQPLWNEGLDFNHGTGHGVGAFGNVHEGPLYILTSAGTADGAPDLFQPGGILTDEPGYYVDGHCGFRIESELEIVAESASFGRTRLGDPYLGFAYLTKVPFCRRLIDKALLLAAEVAWINRYHATVLRELGPQLLCVGERRAYDWLVNETQPV